MCKINNKILVLYYTKVLYLQRTLKHTIMKKGQKLQYIGKGFLNYIPEQPIMYFAMNDLTSNFDIWVDYNGYRLMVRKSEVKEINE